MICYVNNIVCLQVNKVTVRLLIVTKHIRFLVHMYLLYRTRDTFHIQLLGILDIHVFSRDACLGLGFYKNTKYTK